MTLNICEQLKVSNLAKQPLKLIKRRSNPAAWCSVRVPIFCRLTSLPLRTDVKEDDVTSVMPGGNTNSPRIHPSPLPFPSKLKYLCSQWWKFGHCGLLLIKGPAEGAYWKSLSVAERIQMTQSAYFSLRHEHKQRALNLSFVQTGSGPTQ